MTNTLELLQKLVIYGQKSFITLAQRSYDWANPKGGKDQGPMLKNFFVRNLQIFVLS